MKIPARLHQPLYIPMVVESFFVWRSTSLRPLGSGAGGVPQRTSIQGGSGRVPLPTRIKRCGFCIGKHYSVPFGAAAEVVPPCICLLKGRARALVPGITLTLFYLSGLLMPIPRARQVNTDAGWHCWLSHVGKEAQQADVAAQGLFFVSAAGECATGANEACDLFVAPEPRCP